MVLFPKNVFSTSIFRLFELKMRKFSKVEKLEELMKKEFFEKKMFLSLIKASSPKREGRKYAGGSWPQCYRPSRMTACRTKSFIYVLVR